MVLGFLPWYVADCLRHSWGQVNVVRSALLVCSCLSNRIASHLWTGQLYFPTEGEDCGAGEMGEKSPRG